MGTLLALHPALLAALTVLPAVVALLRAWIRHRTAVRVEQEHTRRVRLAVEGSVRGQRAAVVWACAELEAASRAGRAGRAGSGGRPRGRTVRGP